MRSTKWFSNEKKQGVIINNSVGNRENYIALIKGHSKYFSTLEEAGAYMISNGYSPCYMKRKGKVEKDEKRLAFFMDQKI